MPQYSKRSTARRYGEIFYFPEHSCKHGHERKRYTANGACVVCQKAHSRGLHVDDVKQHPESVKMGFHVIPVTVHVDDMKALTDYADALLQARRIQRSVEVMHNIDQARAGLISGKLPDNYKIGPFSNGR